MTNTYFFSQSQAFCLFSVFALHVVAATLVNAYPLTHTHMLTMGGIGLPLMYALYLIFAEEQGFNRFVIFWLRLKKNLLTKRGFRKTFLRTLYAVMLSGLLFLLMKTGEWFGYYDIPESHKHEISLVYLLLSVPGQQLLFFIWPRLLLGRFVQPWILFVFFVFFFGNIHRYYPGFSTSSLALITLGIPSGWLSFYKKDNYAGIFAHMAIGSFAIWTGLV